MRAAKPIVVHEIPQTLDKKRQRQINKLQKELVLMEKWQEEAIDHLEDIISLRHAFKREIAFLKRGGPE